MKTCDQPHHDSVTSGWSMAMRVASQTDLESAVVAAGVNCVLSSGPMKLIGCTAARHTSEASSIDATNQAHYLGESMTPISVQV